MNRPARLIDTHTHLTMEDYADCLDAVLARARQAGVWPWITIGTDLEDSRRGVALGREHEGVFCTVGIHPHEARGAEAGYLQELRDLARAPSVRAIGEIGLDYHYDYSPRPRQQRVFCEQLELAGALRLPVVIHCREALADCLAILKESRPDDVPLVFHCFGGGRQQADPVLDLGGFLSFTGVLTFRNAVACRESAGYAPLERIMLETDCPYLSPEPKRNVRPNEPSLLWHVAETLAELRNMSTADLADITTANAERFFDLPCGGSSDNQPEQL
ncbi:MAG: TatD family hydrolase [Sedimentisphaerales bacterium]|nr:TatD family hydrolase [Sedimentisphaerales bacterium]